MVNPSGSSLTSLNLLLHEIESIPKPYWAELLGVMRQFRRRVVSTPSTPIDLEQAQKNQAAIDLLDSWLGDNEDEAEHRQAWSFLKTALDEDRLSERLLFP